MKPFQVRSTREVYRNPWIRVREDAVARPGGADGIFGVVEMKAGSSVLAVGERQEVTLVREYKYAIGRESLEVISGAIDEGESPLEAAQRELGEEAGLQASEWLDMGAIDPFTTVVCSRNYLFLATGLRQGASAPDPGESVRTEKVPFGSALDMVLRGEITHGASCVLILKAARHLGM